MSSGFRGKNPTTSVSGRIHAVIDLPVSRQIAIRERPVRISLWPYRLIENSRFYYKNLRINHRKRYIFIPLSTHSPATL
jgi:hypothetical protein